MTTETTAEVTEKPFEISTIGAKLPLVNEETASETDANSPKKPRESRVFNHGTGHVTFVQALKLITASRSTLARYANEGKLSFETDPKGNKLFQVTELERVFGKLKSPETDETSPADDEKDQLAPQEQDTETAVKMALLEQEIQFLREKAERAEQMAQDAKISADQWRQQAERATLILTDQRSQPEPQQPKRGILGAIFGGRSR